MPRDANVGRHLSYSRRVSQTRVLAAHPNTELYGSDRMFLASVRALLAVGAAVTVALPALGPLDESLRGEGIEVVTLPFPVLRKVEWSRDLLWKSAATHVAGILRLVRFLRRRRIRVVYVNTIVCPVWVLAAKIACCRVICHVHENESALPRPAQFALLAPLRLCDAVIANSQATYRWLVDAGIADARAQVIYNGVQAPQLAHAARGVGDGVHHLLLVGRLSHRKGQDVAVAALALVRAAGWDADLTLVGDCYPGYEAYVAELRSSASERGLNSRITFVGFAPETEMYYSMADVVLVPSRVEPFGNVAVEALQYGKPVVVSAVQGLTEIVRHEQDGLVVSPDEPVALAGAVIRLLEDPDYAAALAAQGKASTTRRFGSDRYSVELPRVVLGVERQGSVTSAVCPVLPGRRSVSIRRCRWPRRGEAGRPGR